jgi:hypothetical protein
MTRIIFCFLSFVLLLTQCSPVYVPNTRNTPLLTGRGEFQGAMQFGTAGIDIQGAYAITNNLAVMANYSYGNHNTDTLNSNSTDNYHKHKYYEGALGYFKNEDIFCFEVFLGYGQGEASSYSKYSVFTSQTEQLVTGKYTRIFLQPSFGINKKVVHVAFTPRFSWVDFSEFSASRSNQKLDLAPSLFVEPAITAKFNFLDNRFYGTIQTGISTCITDAVVFDYEHFSITTGLGFRLGGFRWSKDNTVKK